MYFLRKCIRILMHVMFILMLLVILYIIMLVVFTGSNQPIEVYGLVALLVILFVGKLFNIVEKNEAKRQLEKQKELEEVERLKKEIKDAIHEQEKIDKGNGNSCSLNCDK